MALSLDIASTMNTAIEEFGGLKRIAFFLIYTANDDGFGIKFPYEIFS